MSLQRWADAGKGSPVPGQRILLESLDDIAVFRPIVEMYFDYYRTPRGFHKRSPNSNGSWMASTPISFMNMPLLTYIHEISPRPILLIPGESAH